METIAETIMPSMLTGVERKLRWPDFKAVDTAPAGVPEEAVAQTIPLHSASGGIPHNVAPAGFKPIYMIPDALTMNVYLDAASWRLTSVSRWTGADQVWLIKHEQGHYDIYALMVRDFFVRVRALIGQPFSDLADLHEQLADHRAATIGRISKLQHDYDVDTANSRNGSEQWNWWCAIQRASQLHRTPLATGPDGRYLRIELAAALEAAGLA
jgi:Bacterial protein of unknown function (DUF922)